MAAGSAARQLGAPLSSFQLLVLVLTDLIDVGGDTRVDRLAIVVPGMFALAVLSTSFTALAIQTGFERRYGVLKRLASSPLPRWGLMTAKTLAYASGKPLIAWPESTEMICLIGVSGVTVRVPTMKLMS